MGSHVYINSCPVGVGFKATSNNGDKGIAPPNNAIDPKSSLGNAALIRSMVARSVACDGFHILGKRFQHNGQRKGRKQGEGIVGQELHRKQGQIHAL